MLFLLFLLPSFSLPRTPPPHSPSLPAASERGEGVGELLSALFEKKNNVITVILMTIVLMIIVVPVNI